MIPNISMTTFMTVFLLNFVTGIVAELCTGQKKISVEPYVGTGIIYPENYPSIKGYEENLVCTWSIITKKGFHIVVFPVVWSCTESSVLSLFYGLTEDADIDSCIGCPFDTGFCFDLIQTRSSEVSLDLYTINMDTNGGFDFRFMAINSSLKDEGCRSSELKLRASRTPNYIISPGFPDHYPGNSDCKWTIEPDLIDNTQLVFQFQSQNLEKKDIHNCVDYVNIEGFGVFCEVSSDRHLRPSPKMIRNSSVTAVRFVSDFAAGGSGFVLSFYLEDKTKPCRCLNGGKCINSSCICQRGYEGDSCEKSSTSFSTIKPVDTTVITRQTTLTTEAVTTTTTPTTEMPSSTTVSSIAPIVTTVHTGQTTHSTETVTTATTPTTELASSTTVSSIAPIVTTVPTRQTTLSTEAITTATTPKTELASSTSFSTIKLIDTTATTRQTTLKTEAVTTATTPTTEMATVPTRQTKLSTEVVTTATTPTTELASSILFSSTVPIDTTVTTKQTTLSTEAITATTPTTKLATIVTTVTTRQTRLTTEAVTTATTPITEMPNILQVLLFESSKSKVREGNSVKFKVLLVSNAAYEFLWYHSGYLVTNSSTRYEISSLKTENGTLHTLFISTALQRDKGEWKIDVTNGVQCTTRNLTIMVIPRLVLQMMPQYDFSVQRDDVLMLQCTVNNPDSLHDVINGSLVIKKGNAILTDVNSTQMFASWRKSSAAEEDSGRYTCIHTGYPDPVFAMVNVAVFQPEQKRCLSEKTDDILWNTTLAGTMKQEPCPGNQKGIATRYCTSDGIWGSTNLIKCITEAYLTASSELEEIIEDGIKNQEKIIEAVSSTLEVMKNLTSSSTEMSAGDLISSMDILEKIVDVTDTTTGPIIEKEVFFSVVDNVLSSNNTKSWTAVSEKTEKDASSLLKNIDRLSEAVIQTSNVNATKFTGSNFELTINKTKIDETGIRFPDLSSSNVSDDTEEFSTFLELPKQDTKAEKAINYVAVIYKSIADILPSNSDQETKEEIGTPKKKAFVNSQVLSLTTQTNIGALSPPLNLAFQHIQSNVTTDMQAVCVSWDFTVNRWTERGCKKGHNDHKRTVCQCYHLTNFAILMRPYTSEKEDTQSLKKTSLVGVILSTAFTALTFFIYIFNWRFIKGDQNVMLLNLCASLVLAYIVFISAVEKTTNEGLCIAITVILHYLFLVTFFNMLGIGVYYFMSITVTYYAMHVANDFKSKSRVNLFLAGAWGIPLIIASSTLGGFWNRGYHLKHYCWLSADSGSLYLFLVPVCCIVVINIFVIVTLIRVLCATSVMMKSTLKKKAASGLRSLGTLLPVLGVTWLFGILAVNENAEVFQYLFILANSLQGFFIFVSHVVMNKRLMQGLRTKYPSLGVLTSLVEPSKKDASVSRSQSFTSDDLINKTKKGRFFAACCKVCQDSKYKSRKVKTYDSSFSERTTNTSSVV
ncbi:uncharacterized protein LOC111126761 isoform X2 [Crassostrea virginica]